LCAERTDTHSEKTAAFLAWLFPDEGFLKTESPPKGDCLMSLFQEPGRQMPCLANEKGAITWKSLVGRRSFVNRELNPL
jgi:hypothetical protein